MDDYKELLTLSEALAEENLWNVSAFANVSSLLFGNLDNINWAGFYLADSFVNDRRCDPEQDKLLLGPFGGKPACVVIPFGKGVCGTAALKKETVAVSDVERFPGHIACDPESRSEIAVPLIAGGRVAGVLDIDSPVKNRFSEKDKQGLEDICRMLEKKIAGWFRL